MHEVFGFFSRAENLSLITPPWMHFEMRSPLPIEMGRGAQIDYRIRLLGLPMAWRTRITEWKRGERFVDIQERGPYAMWEHTHEFRERGSGVLMTDRVDYRLPFGVIGRVTRALAVRATLSAIFDFRYRRVQEIYADKPDPR
jgi:hypothetical protein